MSSQSKVVTVSITNKRVEQAGGTDGNRRHRFQKGRLKCEKEGKKAGN